jgi:subtilase family serine protease
MLAESNETNNTAYKTGYKLTVRSGVDLSDGGEGTSYFSPRTVYPGAYFAIHHNVRNTGELTASNVVVRYYVSTDTTITSSDRLIGESTIPTILPGNSASGDWAALFPSGIPVGTYWVGWIIDPDNAFAEIYENNNTIRKTSYQLSVVNAPDLVDAGAAYQSFSPTTVYYGRPFSISCDIRNAGLAAAPGYAVSFYASTDTTITAGDTYLGYRAMGGLAAGATADCDHSLTFPPLADGLYYVGWIIDSLNAVSETDETNNVAYNVNGRLRVLNPTVDLSEADPGMRSFSPEAVKGGDPFSVSIAVGNGGTVGSGPFVVRFYASPDKGITGADWLIGESAVADLPSKGEAKVSWSGTFPVLIPAGSYYVGWIIDAAGAVGETDETNNTGFVNDPQLAVETEPLPDLTDGGEAQRSFSPRKMRTGETISISFLLVNQGYEAAKGFVVRFYASEDREITPGDRLIGETPVAELAPRDNVTCSFSGPLPGTIPPGEYGVGWIIDAGGSVEELNEGNNTAICQESSLIVTETENQAPTDLALSPSSVMENQAAGTVVGALSTTDPDAGDIHAYSLVAGTGSADNGLFTIVGSQLRSAVILDYETKPGCAVRVRTTDQGGLWYEEALTVAVVNDPSDDPAGSSFANIATRGKVLTGANILIGGITVAGTSQKTFVFRGLGPSLTAYGVPGALANPVIRVYSGATVVATNDDWGSLSPADRTVLSAEGLTPTHPRDSALVLTLNPGPYTLHLSGLNNGTGVGLVEVYETSLWGAGSPPDEGGVIEEDERLLELQGYRRGSGVVPVTLWEPAAKVAAQEEEPSLATSATDGLSNIATRGKVLTGADVMIAGFTIVGGDPMTVVIRGIGPSLAAYGVPGALANPMLQVYSGSTVIATNDNWGTLGSSDKAVLTMEGLTPTHSLEAAVVLTLAPGPYTAVLSGVNKGTGVGLVEVYDAAKW